jgi:RNA polymerase sigma-70 factor, ECF subfamily
VPVAASTVANVAQTLTESDFDTLTTPLRGELVAHCYRMLGSVQDAEDQVQETYLRAWRAFNGFEGRSSVRTWMYQIATRTCLTALQQRTRRPMPTGLGAPSSEPTDELQSRPEVPWLEPLPGALLAGPGLDPAAVATARDGVRLAFVAALQHLTPLQRAVVILRDVLAFSAAETAAALDVSVASANSALQRARARLGKLALAGSAESPPGSPRDEAALADREKELLDRFMQAFEAYDTAALVALLAADATWEMPPFVQWYTGAEAIGELIRHQCPANAPGDLRYVATTANGQPACAGWLLGPDGVHRAFQLLVLEPGEGPGGRLEIRHVACFFDTALFDKFGFSDVLPAEGG